ncbi:MAG: response regulator, partial [Bacteroidales bacterium]|nr:response regulator [Bacteroidales bacterium]
MKALIVEDERMAQAQLTRLLESRFPDIEVVAATGSVGDTVAYLAADPPIDVIFMDVELADGECFEIFRQVPVRAQVIMTTAYDTYAVKAFEAGSIDYLLKPIGEEALARAVGRCRERIAQQAAA